MKYLYAYRNIFVPANAITLISCYTFWSLDSITTLSVLFWVKVLTTTTLILYIHIFKTEIIVFFMNLGIGILRLYASMFTIDLIVFAILLSLTAAIK